MNISNPNNESGNEEASKTEEASKVKEDSNANESQIAKNDSEELDKIKKKEVSNFDDLINSKSKRPTNVVSNNYFINSKIGFSILFFIALFLNAISIFFPVMNNLLIIGICAIFVIFSLLNSFDRFIAIIIITFIIIICFIVYFIFPTFFINIYESNDNLSMVVKTIFSFCFANCIYRYERDLPDFLTKYKNRVNCNEMAETFKNSLYFIGYIYTLMGVSSFFISEAIFNQDNTGL